MTMPDIDALMRYEQDDMPDEEIIDLFQDLVDTGYAWKLQGHYGRTAMALIEQGYVVPPDTGE